MLAIVVVAWGVGGCKTPAATHSDTAAPPADTVRIEEMTALLDAIEEAKARGTLAALQAELEKAAEGRDPWSVTKAAWAQMPTDADAAWNRLHEVTVVDGDRGPPSYWAHLGMAEVYIRWKVFDQAEAQIAAAEKIAPGLWPARAARGALAAAQGHTEEAQAHDAAALEAAGGPGKAPRVAMALARLKLADGDADGARALVEGVLEARPKRADALLLAAELAEGDPAAQAAYLKRALALAPENLELRERLARALDAAGDPKGALEAWRQVAHGAPLKVQAWREQARLARVVGDEAAEREALEHVAQLANQDVESLRRLAELQLAADEPVEAEETLSRLIERARKDVPARLARGKLRVEAQDYRGALEDFRVAEAQGSEEAAEARKKLEAELGFPGRVIEGKNPDQVYRRVASVLFEVYSKRLEEMPRLGGMLSIRVEVEGGRVVHAEIEEDTLHDPALEAVAWWTLMDARFPKRKGRQEYTLPFEFTPPNGK
ncbi:MAG: hypothetical protein D6729_04780 [Deltaproteobacteria bacterium]|nr:MAG: hypothetical protein D6729_04780 [Deltaproteobacteria bacterium]